MLFIKKNRFFYPLVFLFFLGLILIVYRELFSSFFESDEWYHFTHYLPLTKQPNGFLTAIFYNYLNTESLSAGAHVTPIASGIFYLNTNFFGFHYEPYAFMSLLFHAINSFLVFLYVLISLSKKYQVRNKIYALLAGIFFALSTNAIHVWTGAAPFYGENILSVTFVLLFLITFKQAFIKKNKIYLYLSLLSILCALFSKETSGYLLMLFPLLVLIENKVFSYKYLSTLFIVLVIFYMCFRFIVPNFSYIESKISHKFFNGPPPITLKQGSEYEDTGTVVSRDTTIYENLPAEVFYRAMSFPLKMIGTIYVPRDSVLPIASFISPIVYHLPPNPSGDVLQNMNFYVYGPGFNTVVYTFSLIIIFLFAVNLLSYYRKKHFEEAKLLLIGFIIIIVSAVPLVLIVFNFPRWGFDTYFDSRYYYHPGVGASILFPFLLFGIATLLTKLFGKMRISIVPSIFVALLLFGWLLNSLLAIQTSMHIIVQLTGVPRKVIFEKMKQTLPSLPKIVVIQTETEGGGAYGPVLPFQTSVPQALTVGYYDKNPLPDSFFTSYLFNGKPEGYQFADGRGFGYYASKKSLADALFVKKFSLNDVYSFYYDSRTVELTDRTDVVRKEMKKYLEERKGFAEWKSFEASTSAEQIKFLYPQDTEITENEIASNEAKIVKDISLSNPEFTGSIKLIRTTPTFEFKEAETIEGKVNGFESIMKKVNFDKYHFNEVLVSSKFDETRYMLKVNDLLVVITTPITDSNNLQTIEKIVGSMYVSLKQ